MNGRRADLLILNSHLVLDTLHWSSVRYGKKRHACVKANSLNAFRSRATNGIVFSWLCSRILFTVMPENYMSHSVCRRG